MSMRWRQGVVDLPGPSPNEWAFSFGPVPDVPMYGARIRVVYAGACYIAHRIQSSSVSSIGSLPGEMEGYGINICAPAHIGFLNGALFPGYEVSGVVDAIGKAADRTTGIQEGSRIVLYPYEGVSHGYVDFIVVPDHNFLVPIPNELPLSVAAMLPTGALLAMTPVYTAGECLKTILEGPNHKDKASVLIVGTGGLALWALRIATSYFKHGAYTDRIRVSVATLNDEGFGLAQESNQ